MGVESHRVKARKTSGVAEEQRLREGERKVVSDVEGSLKNEMQDQL